MTTDPHSPNDTVHWLNRKGGTLKVQVAELPGGQEYGHVLVFGDIKEGCLVRIHSRCFYGEVLRSDDCDCGAEIDKTMDMIQEAGAGVLIYMEQEGRGAGLVNKARGYNVQERTGADTFDSYKSLGLAPDGRDYLLAITSLLQLNLESLRVLTNNPDKVSGLKYVGLDISVEPLLVPPCNERVRKYMESKRIKRNHWIPAALTARVAPEPTKASLDWTSQSAPMGGYAIRAPRFNKPKVRTRRSVRFRTEQPVPIRPAARMVRETDFDVVEVWDDPNSTLSFPPTLSGMRGVRTLLWEIKRRWAVADQAAAFTDQPPPPRVA
ncbi:GTP cyclohydrolase II [Nocardia sp. NBC_01499]|uniref:GTP cyclohydrolase II n=1 Tax=Nocardia sp. NBC_01499 TaxID=2903597 RepID=UPI00386EAC49